MFNNTTIRYYEVNSVIYKDTVKSKWN